MDFDLLLQAMGNLFIKSPAYALVFAVFFFSLFLAKRKRSTLVAALAWTAYFLNELAMKKFFPETNIRVDLLLFYPLLILVSFVGLATFVTAIFSSKKE